MEPLYHSLKHLAIIPDGNNRWAKKNNLFSIKGYQAGIQNLFGIVNSILEHQIPYLSFFAFSSENMNRREEDIENFLQLFLSVLVDKRHLLMEKGINLHILGDLKVFSTEYYEKIQQVCKETTNNKALYLSLYFNYGSRQEILLAFKKLILNEFIPNYTQTVDSKKYSFTQDDLNKFIESISHETFYKNLFTAEMPEVDFLIRTGEEQRLSNFLLYQSGYAELYFSSKLWPDFTVKDLGKAFKEFETRERRFGGKSV